MKISMKVVNEGFDEDSNEEPNYLKSSSKPSLKSPPPPPSRPGTAAHSAGRPMTRGVPDPPFNGRRTTVQIHLRIFFRDLFFRDFF